MVAVVNETLVNTFWRGRNPIGLRLRPCCGDQVPWFTVVGVAKDVKQGGVDQKTGTELYFFTDQTSLAAQPVAFSPRDDKRRAPHHAAAGGAGANDRARGSRNGSHGAHRAASRHGHRVRRIDPAPQAARASARRVCGIGAAARRHRHLRRADIHGGGAPPRNRHPHVARRRSLESARADHEAGARAHRHRCRRGPCRRIRPQPADCVAAFRRAADRCDDTGRGDGDDCARGRRWRAACRPGARPVSIRTWCSETTRRSFQTPRRRDVGQDLRICVRSRRLGRLGVRSRAVD